MGRPLNKKYFGNRNIGTVGTTDDYGIGGEGLAAYSLAVQKGVVNITDTYKYFPTLSIPAPDLPTGTPATAVVVWEINTITLSGAGSGYPINLNNVAIDQLLGSIWTSALTTPAITISTDGTGAITAATLGANRGTWTTIDGTTISTWGIKLGAVNSGQITATFRLKSITTNEKGSGYIAAPTLSWTRASSQTAGGQTAVGVPTVALTVDSGNIGSSTYQENAIIAYAWVAGQREIVDIVKQSGSRRYTVRGADGLVYRAKLTTAADSSATGDIDIYAYDSAGNTYYVNKLTERRAYLTRKSGGSNYVYANGESAPWSFAAATGIYVKVNNA